MASIRRVLFSTLFATSILASPFATSASPPAHPEPAPEAARPAPLPPQRDPEAALLGLTRGETARLRGEMRPAAPLRLRLSVAGAAMTLVLESYSVRAPAFKVVLQDRTGEHLLDPGPVRTVRGTIAEIPGSLVLGIVRDSGLEASLQTPGGSALWLEPAASKRSGARADLYSLTQCESSEGSAGTGKCGVTAGPRQEMDFKSLATKAGVANCANLGGCLAEILCDTDSAYYAASNSSSAQVQANVESLMNFMIPRFQTPFNITHRLSMVKIRSNPATDPYADPSITTDSQMLNAVTAQWPQGSHTSDLVHLVSARSVTGSLAGAGWVGGVCSFGSFGMVSFSTGVGADCGRAARFIHELGHSWGSLHTCGIMSIFPPSDCNAPWCGSTLTDIPTNRDRVAPVCLDLAVPPQASFSFTCSGLACTFDGSASTDDLGIASYGWTFGDAATGSGPGPSHSYAASGTYSATLTVTDMDGLTASRTRKVSVDSASPLPSESFFALPPCRIFDSRNTTILTSGVNRTIQISGSCGVPATAKAVSLNVAVVAPTGAGHLVLQPGNLPPTLYGAAPPIQNFDPATSPRTNNAVVRLATDGSGTLVLTPFVAATPGQVHVIVDVSGYFSEDTVAAPGAQGPLGFQSITPCRLADTRTSTPLVAAVPRNFTVKGVCAVPASAIAAQINLTAIQPSSTGYLVLYPSDLPIPGVSSINFNAGVAALANGLRTRLAASTPDVSMVYGAGAGGATVHATLDIAGYFAGTAPLKYHPLVPCRAVDTRNADQGGPALAGGENRSFQIRGNCGVPLSAKAAALNLVAVTPSGAGFLTAYPAGTPFPGTANLTFDPGLGTLGNGTVVALGTSSNDLTLTAGVSGTNAIVDVFGYFE